MAPGVDLVQVVFDRSQLNPQEDVAILTMHCRGVQAGLPDVLNPMDDTNRGNFAGKLDTWWTAVKAYVCSKYTLREYRFYALPDSLGLPMGPPDKIVTKGINGVSAPPPMPSQVALSVTFKTDQRKQWGRFYIPGIVNSNLDNNGRFVAAMTGTIANATKGLTDRNGSGACLTVWSRTQWTHHDPQTIQVDDIPDVIRSRRLSFPITRSQVAAT
jgi:hypothetical protein